MISYKVRVQDSNSSLREIRRFDAIVRYNYQELCNTLKTLIPGLKTNNFTILWKELGTGDLITISSEQELDIAAQEHEKGTKWELWVKILEKENERPRKEEVLHYGVICDNCNKGVIGYRYKCVQCNDFDLCSQCEALGVHSGHYMLRMPQPLHVYTKERFFQYLNKLRKRIDTLTLNADFYVSVWEERKREEPKKENEKVEENAEKKFPGKGRRLKNLVRKSEESMSDAASTSSQESIATKIMGGDGWTIVDNNGTAGSTPVTQTSLDAKGADANQNPSPRMTQTASQENSTQTLYPELLQEKVVHHKNPLINDAIETMLKMGFSNQGGLLTYLLLSENGDINKVLELLQPSDK